MTTAKDLTEHAGLERKPSDSGDSTRSSSQTCSELAKATIQTTNIFKGVIDPVPGEIYQSYYNDGVHDGWWMCTPLPWDRWESTIGIRFSLKQANMFCDIPGCYKTGRVRANTKKKRARFRYSRRMKSVITGWKEGFELGGPREAERVFPVLFFDDKPGEPGNFNFQGPEKPFTFSQKALRALPAEWITAANLRLQEVYVGSVVERWETATRFKERVRDLRKIQERKKLCTTSRYMETRERA